MTPWASFVMVMVFTAHHAFPFPFRDIAHGIWHKYPNDYSSHITSVDVVDQSFLPNGTIRTERLITIRQNAPRWIMKLVGSSEDQYVREVIFYKPAALSNQKPMILMSSINLTMSSFLVCREQIRYQPSCSNSTNFIQRAVIQAQGSLASGNSWGILGSKLETWSRDRFASNAANGRQGFYSVLNSLFGPRHSAPSSSSMLDTAHQGLTNPSDSIKFA
ncbi:hypothetical protein O181_056022 [Austropuccinia psidii MF-1]|uniref:PRELI/MSF1 domain-containing protein n=1 Tax=Austropuccinia psidii MF-1 TaxID=1389203 RepID=A0A9Q3EA11_9BASI|nr:hypothetical protein [Austropuccinia psidii MF-1]